jgi:hypothetical protein
MVRSVEYAITMWEAEVAAAERGMGRFHDIRERKTAVRGDSMTYGRLRAIPISRPTSV